MRSFHRRYGATAVAVAAVSTIGLAACGGQASTTGSTKDTGSTNTTSTGSALTVGFSVQAPATLDPAKAPQNYAWFEELAYEPLIVQRSDGSLAPGLAASWSYTGTGNTTFVLQLRSGVKFSDGSPLTAQDVVNDLNYVVKSAGQMSPFFAGDTFTATGPLTVPSRRPAPTRTSRRS
jgi:peptide/nickel transport system substrate-binding protein